jgi:RNA-directed DNA polymerase
MPENRETSTMPNPPKGSGRLGKAKCRTPSANVAEESDLGIVLMNQPNKVELQATAEAGEEAKGQGEFFIVQHAPTQSGSSMSQGLWRVREAAKRNKKIRFNALLHYVTTSFLRDCFYALKRQAAPGGGWSDVARV